MHLSKRGTKVAIWSSLLVATAANPVPASDSGQDLSRALNIRVDSPIKNKEQWCADVDRVDTLDKAQAILDRTSIGATIGIFVRQDGSHSDYWLPNFVRYTYMDLDESMDLTTVTGCASLEETCEPRADSKESCKKAFDKGAKQGSQWYKEAWWVFRVVQGAHTKLNAMRSSLTKNTIATGLELGQMAVDFETALDDERFSVTGAASWFSAASGAASGLTGLAGDLLHPGVGVALGVLSTAVGMVEEDEDQAALNVTGIGAELGSMFVKSADNLDFTARLAVGIPYPAEKKAAEDAGQDPWDMLPTGGMHDHDEQIANFYDHPFWLLDSISDPVNDVLDSAGKYLRFFVLDRVIKGLGYAVSWDVTIEKDECNDEGATKGAKWVEVGGKGRCFVMVYADGDSYKMVPDDTKLFDNMKKYGIEDVTTYILSSIDCARSKCVNAQPLGIGNFYSDLPLCFFSAPVLKHERHGGTCSSERKYNCYETEFQDFVAEKDKQECGK